MANNKPRNNDHINLKVTGQDGSVVKFKIKNMQKQPINDTDTPSQLEMEDEDTIEVFQQIEGNH
ncbi:small ubiquitin-related modifier 2-like [Bufo gargarizans]|uniref:small ubiquitin-related modifier 2-like n=1 Tax=Bufo gargarizans TaxID=30331 RepID=UPI001CF3881C|nr:small ubiquitin-related modifier 2-like [Bufo gargarizans]